MLPDRVSNPGPLTYESGALPIALRGPATLFLLVYNDTITWYKWNFSTMPTEKKSDLALFLDLALLLKGGKIDERKNVQTARTRTCCKRYRALPYYSPN